MVARGHRPGALERWRIRFSRGEIAVFMQDWYDHPGIQRKEVMPMTMKDLGIDRLSPAERISLALEIWESLGDARPSAVLTAAQLSELARRDAEMDANPGIALTWEQIRAGVETRP
jgi:putative addiction module component (TIGR02574 family)